MMVKGIIFDLDGTLLDSMPAWENVGADLLKSKGIKPPKNLDDIIKTMSFEESALYFIEGCGLDMNLSECLGAVNNMVLEKYKNSIPLKPYAKEFINSLKEKGIKMCIATANDHDLMVHALKRLEILNCFEFVITCSMVGASKREPLIYDTAAKRLNIKKEHLLVFEDCLHCIEVLKKNGYKTIGVYDKANQEDIEKIKQLSDIYIESFKELLDKELF